MVVPLRALTVVTGANGSGKSSLYRALRLLADCGRGGVIGALAREGGLTSALWAGPESLTGARHGAEVQGIIRKGPISLRLGFASDDLGYLVDLGLPQPSTSAFARDPEIKREIVFSGPVMRPASSLVRRRYATVQAAVGPGRWELLTERLATYRSMLTEIADPSRSPELFTVREQLRSWRFYDGFRTDLDAPARRPQVGTRTLVLADDGSDLAAALQTIHEEDPRRLAQVVADAFDGAQLEITVAAGLFDVQLHQPGMLRPLRTAELSDGTLRYLLWTAALLTVLPPPLMVLNEPETSLHPDLLPPLARLIRSAAERTQLIVVTHSRALIDLLGVQPLDPDEEQPAIEVELLKDLGETQIPSLGMLTTPQWEWGRRQS